MVLILQSVINIDDKYIFLDNKYTNGSANFTYFSLAYPYYSIRLMMPAIHQPGLKRVRTVGSSGLSDLST